MQHAKHQVLVEFSNEKSNFFWNTDIFHLYHQRDGDGESYERE